MTTQHTLGPWHWSGDALTHRQFDIYAPTQAPHQHVCTVNNLPVEKLYARDATVALANARLIAAAPDVLAALRNVIASYRANDPDSMANAVNDAEAAIAKATGGCSMSPQRWEVLTLIGNDWENVWSIDDEPETFDSYGEASAALDEYLRDCRVAYIDGDMTEPPLGRDEFQIAPYVEVKR